MSKDAQEFKDKYAAQVVKGLGNDFEGMKSSRLGNALKGAQESIIKKRIDNGELSVPSSLNSGANTNWDRDWETYLSLNS